MKVSVLLSVTTLGSVHSLALIQMMTNGWGPRRKGPSDKKWNVPMVPMVKEKKTAALSLFFMKNEMKRDK
mgnify:CR=1 FL=1